MNNEPQKNSDKKLTIGKNAYFCGTLFLTLICAFLRSAMYFFSYDREIGYYNVGTPWLIVFYLLTGTALIALLLLSISAAKADLQNSLVRRSVISPEMIVSTLASMLLTIHGILLLKQAATPINIIYTVSSAISLVYFLMNAHPSNKSKLGIRVLCGYTLIIALAIMVYDIYSNRYIPMNNPDKTYLILTISVFMIYFVQEFRFELGMPKRKSFLFFSALSILLGFTFSASHLVSYIFKLNSLTGEAYVYHDLILMSLSVYVLLKLANYIKSFSAETTDNEDKVFVEKSKTIESDDAE